MRIGPPPDAVPYKRTPSFTEENVPAGLLADHDTKEGTWGLIVVEKGQLRYIVDDPRRPRSERILTPDTDPGVIEPTVRHRVAPLGVVRFHVEFLRIPTP